MQFEISHLDKLDEAPEQLVKGPITLFRSRALRFALAELLGTGSDHIMIDH